jgi:hypothetical protein
VDYINTFLKLKAKASGYPGWVRGPEDEERYVESFWQSVGVRLDRDSIRANAARRGLAKVCLNSMWGKLTERSDRAQTQVISEPRELYTFLSTPGIEELNLAFDSDDVIWLSYKYAAEEPVPICDIRTRSEALTSLRCEDPSVSLSRQAARESDLL